MSLFSSKERRYGGPKFLPTQEQAMNYRDFTGAVTCHKFYPPAAGNNRTLQAVFSVAITDGHQVKLSAHNGHELPLFKRFGPTVAERVTIRGKGYVERRDPAVSAWSK